MRPGVTLTGGCFYAAAVGLIHGVDWSRLPTLLTLSPAEAAPRHREKPPISERLLSTTLALLGVPSIVL